MKLQIKWKSDTYNKAFLEILLIKLMKFLKADSKQRPYVILYYMQHCLIAALIDQTFLSESLFWGMKITRSTKSIYRYNEFLIIVT